MILLTCSLTLFMFSPLLTSSSLLSSMLGSVLMSLVVVIVVAVRSFYFAPISFRISGLVVKSAGLWFSTFFIVKSALNYFRSFTSSIQLRAQAKWAAVSPRKLMAYCKIWLPSICNFLRIKSICPVCRRCTKLFPIGTVAFFVPLEPPQPIIEC